MAKHVGWPFSIFDEAPFQDQYLGKSPCLILTENIFIFELNKFLFICVPNNFLII